MWRCDPLAEVLFLEGHGVPIHLFLGVVLVLVMVMVCFCFPMVGSCSASWLMCTTCVCTCGGEVVSWWGWGGTRRLACCMASLISFSFGATLNVSFVGIRCVAWLGFEVER